MELKLRAVVVMAVAALAAACKPEGQEQQEQALEKRYEQAKQQCEALQGDARQACEDEAEQTHKQQLDALKRRGGGLGGAGDPAGGGM